MPAPTVRAALDGLVWQGVLAGDFLACDAWVAETREATVRPREEALVGALQSPSRTLEQGATRLAVGASVHGPVPGLGLFVE